MNMLEGIITKGSLPHSANSVLLIELCHQVKYKIAGKQVL